MTSLTLFLRAYLLFAEFTQAHAAFGRGISHILCFFFFFFFFFYFYLLKKIRLAVSSESSASKKIRFDVSSESSARQRIHLKTQVLFSLKNNENIFMNVIWRFKG